MTRSSSICLYGTCSCAGKKTFNLHLLTGEIRPNDIALMLDLHYVGPYLTTTRMQPLQEYGFVFKNVPDPGTFNRRLIANYDAFLRNKRAKKGAAANGIMFEILMVEALAAYGLLPEPARVSLNVNTSQKTELDILIRPKEGGQDSIALLLKSSLRERWAQADRTALGLFHNAKNCREEIFNMPFVNLRCWCIWYREHIRFEKRTDLKPTSHHEPQRTEPLFGLYKLCSVFHDDAMEILRRDLLAIL